MNFGENIMGGMGSGTWVRIRRKGKTEERAAFDIRLWKRNDWLESCSLSMSNGTEILTAFDRVHYKNTGIDHHSGRQVTVRELVILAERRCHLGGSRPMFVCPGCDSQVFLLYATGLHYRCRRCVKLAYESQSETKQQRIMRRGNYLVRRLDPSAYFTFAMPPKPPRMRQTTYRRIVDEVDRLSAAFYPLALISSMLMVKHIAAFTGDPVALELMAAIENGTYLDFEFPEIELGDFDLPD